MGQPQRIDGSTATCLGAAQVRHRGTPASKKEREFGTFLAKNVPRVETLEGALAPSGHMTVWQEHLSPVSPPRAPGNDLILGFLVPISTKNA
jgi:hypothetical protein